MRHKSFGNMQCPVARSLERVGESWSILILRDALQGLRRFDEFQKSLEIAPNILTRRLNAMVESGLLDRRRYNEHPLRYEYVPTALADEFRAVLWALIAWGNRNFAPEGKSVVIIDSVNRVEADPVLIDRTSGRVLAHPAFISAPGPVADARTRRRYALAAVRLGRDFPASAAATRNIQG